MTAPERDWDEQDQRPASAQTEPDTWKRQVDPAEVIRPGQWAVFRTGRSQHCVVGFSHGDPVAACGAVLPTQTRDVEGPRCKTCDRRWTRYQWQWSS